MKRRLTASNLVVALGLLALGICISSFRGTDSTEYRSFRKETFRTPDDTTRRSKGDRSNNEIRVEQLDEAMKHLDQQMLKLDEQMKKLDVNKIEKDIKAAGTHQLDAERISKSVEASLARIDWKKIEADMQEAKKHMKEDEWKRMDKEVEEAKKRVKDVDVKKIKEEVQKASAAKAKMNFDKDKMRHNVDEAMAKAKVSMEKAKAEIQNMKDFTNALQSDGLIDKTVPYKIEVRGGDLYINDVKQPKEVSDKYRKYFKKENFSIINEGNKSGVSI